MKGHHPSSMVFCPWNWKHMVNRTNTWGCDILQPTTCGNPAKNRDSWITTSHILKTGIIKPRIKHPHLGLIVGYTWYTSVILYLAWFKMIPKWLVTGMVYWVYPMRCCCPPSSTHQSCAVTSMARSCVARWQRWGGQNPIIFYRTYLKNIGKLGNYNLCFVVFDQWLNNY